MRVVIIGASGAIGSSIIAALRALPHMQITPCSRKGVEGCFVFDPDLHDWSILGEQDVLINCAGIIRESREDDFKKVHLDLVRTILANRARIGNPRIIHISALGADPAHDIAFLRTKGLGDELLLSHPDTYVLRPSIVCLSGTLLVKKFKWLVFMCKVLQNRPIMPQGFAETRVQPVMPEDLNELLHDLCLQPDIPAGAIDVVGSTPFSFKELLLLASGKEKLFPIELPKKLIEPVTRNFISVWFPELMNYDQFKLLFKDNVASTEGMERILGHPVRETRSFWTHEFQHLTLSDIL
ncbi:MAG: hypothetical protein ACT6QS_13730 [Flavobacteriales bacterium]